jgi:hypothetical protein
MCLLVVTTEARERERTGERGSVREET